MDEPVSVQRAGLKEKAEALVSSVDNGSISTTLRSNSADGGVGFYKHSSRMHVDAGLFRYW